MVLVVSEGGKQIIEGGELPGSQESGEKKTVEAGGGVKRTVETGGGKVSYAGVVDGSCDSSSSQPVFEVKFGVAEIEIPEEFFGDVEPLWKCFMVGYFRSFLRMSSSCHCLPPPPLLFLSSAFTLQPKL
ncbi:hypothetical protein Bca52824_014930 [Brassica carinata]|uniref:Uncharacterized protein n=1 Tax=Brassica carinata TaxID=52824 RepID=A0A8X8B591_BRACI|nr:hypothetical protein Bca52824_014930 [Brassica carinata]